MMVGDVNVDIDDVTWFFIINLYLWHVIFMDDHGDGISQCSKGRFGIVWICYGYDQNHPCFIW